MARWRQAGAGWRLPVTSLIFVSSILSFVAADYVVKQTRLRQSKLFKIPFSEPKVGWAAKKACHVRLHMESLPMHSALLLSRCLFCAQLQNCICQNTSLPIDLESVQWAVAKSMSRSPLLSYRVDWDDLKGPVAANPEGVVSPSVGNSLVGSNCQAGKDFHEVEASRPETAKQQEMLMECLNEHHTPQRHGWVSALQDDTTTLKVLGTFWSDYSQDYQVTLVTTSTADRLAQLEAQCRSWPGPLSVALFQGIIQTDGSDTLNATNLQILRQSVVAVRSVVVSFWLRAEWAWQWGGLM
jgi:hypothetical protein